jgi:hypothetical protein
MAFFIYDLLNYLPPRLDTGTAAGSSEEVGIPIRLTVGDTTLLAPLGTAWQGIRPLQF